MLRNIMAAAVLLLAGGWSLASHAIDMNLTLRYRGQPDGLFENTTLPASFCAVWPRSCQSGRAGYTADVPLTYAKTIISGAPDLRDRMYIHLPGERQVEVVNENGVRYTLTFRLYEVSQNLQLLSRRRLTLDPRGGCSLNIALSNTTYFRYQWRIINPAAPDVCHANGGGFVGDVNEVAVSQFGVRYDLVMPRPIGMPQGIYRGSLNYSVGPGGDFDFGNAVTNLNADQLTVNFELDVQHDLYLQFPPGSDRAVLEPPGGWMAWLGGRGAPPRLYRDLPLRIWSSGPIKVYKRCQYELGGMCGLREDAGHLVPVQVAITLPGNMQHNGAPISRLAIPTRQAAALPIEATSMAWNQPGQLHFEVAGSEMPSMLAHPGSRYEGLVTVVFEAQL